LRPGHLAQVDLGDPGRVREQDLHLAPGLGAPEPGFHPQRAARHALVVQQPAPAGVDEEGLAVVAEVDLLAEVEALDRRVAADPGAIPAAEQEPEGSQVGMRLRPAVRHRWAHRPGPGHPAHRAEPSGSPGTAARRQSPPPPRPRRTRLPPAPRSSSLACPQCMQAATRTPPAAPATCRPPAAGHDGARSTGPVSGRELSGARVRARAKVRPWQPTPWSSKLLPARTSPSDAARP